MLPLVVRFLVVAVVVDTNQLGAGMSLAEFSLISATICAQLHQEMPNMYPKLPPVLRQMLSASKDRHTTGALGPGESGLARGTRLSDHLDGCTAR